MEPIYKPLYVNIDITKLNEPLDLMFELFNNSYTITATYNDPLFKNQHCKKGYNRSLNDIYCIFKTYFPYINLLGVIIVMKEYNDILQITSNGEETLITFFCKDIYKNVWKLLKGNFHYHNNDIWWYYKKFSFNDYYKNNYKNIKDLSILSQDEMMTIWENI